MNDGKKIKYNLLVGMIGQVVTLVLGILLPKLLITSYGSEVNGLLSSVTNIYAYIALVEAGIAATSCQALYKPIAEKNQKRINSILVATDKYYRKSGAIYFALIIAFALIYPNLINTDIPYHTIVVIIFANGIGNVISYFFHGKYLILLKADGKNYVRTGLDTVTNAFTQIVKILLIKLGYDVVFVQLAAMFVSFIKMGYIIVYIKRHYSWLDLTVKPDVDSMSQSKNVVIHELNYFVTSNVDTALLTFFQSLKVVSVYSLYNLLFGTLNTMLRVIRDSIEFKLAYIFHRDKEAFREAYGAFEVCYITLAFAVFSVAYYFAIPFIKCYTIDVTDISYVIPQALILFVLVNLLASVRYPSEAMIHIAGHFAQTQASAAIETMINILVSLALIRRMGIAGVLLGTVASQVYRANYLILYVNTKIVERKPKISYLCCLINFLVFVVMFFANQFIAVKLDTYARIFAFCIPYTLGTILLYFSVILGCMKMSILPGFSTVKAITKRYIKRA